MATFYLCIFVNTPKYNSFIICQEKKLKEYYDKYLLVQDDGVSKVDKAAFEVC